MRDNKNLMKNQNTVSWHTEYPRSWFNNLVFYSSFVAVLLAIFDTGFEFNLWFQGFTSSFYLLALTLSLIELLLHCRRWYARSTMLAVFNTLTAMLVVALIVTHFVDEDSSLLYKFLFEKSLIKIAVLLSFIRQLFERDFEFKFAVTHPAQLFIISYLLLILLGTFLLMMPNASYGYLSFVDALFTATSAVCITGLTVKDTGAFFTPLGQVIIICLIQLGGLGILTFATYFGYFFRGKISYETQLTIGQVTASNRLGDVLKTLKVILVVTFGVELMAAIAIYLSVLDLSMSTSNRLFFAIFHAISAFCNAGFSTLSDSLHHEQVQFNYALQLIIVVTFLFGGLGFVIVANVLSYLKHRLLRLVSPNPHRHGAKPWPCLTDGCQGSMAMVDGMLECQHGHRHDGLRKWRHHPSMRDKDVAEALNLPVGTIRSWKSRGKIGGDEAKDSRTESWVWPWDVLRMRYPDLVELIEHSEAA